MSDRLEVDNPAVDVRLRASKGAIANALKVAGHEQNKRVSEGSRIVYTGRGSSGFTPKSFGYTTEGFKVEEDWGSTGKLVVTHQGQSIRHDQPGRAHVQQVEKAQIAAYKDVLETKGFVVTQHEPVDRNGPYRYHHLIVHGKK